MGKSVLYAANTVSQAVAENGVVNFGTVVRRYGCDTNLSGGNILINGIGYYSIDANLTITASGAGPVVVTLYKDGVAIPGATATRTTAATVIYSITIPAIIRQKCCCDSTITCVISGEDVTVENAAIAIVKD